MKKPLKKTISDAARSLFDIFSKPGITSISKNNKFTGAVLSAGKISETDRDEITQLLDDNPRAAVEKLLNLLIRDDQRTIIIQDNESWIVPYIEEGTMRGIYISTSGLDEATCSRILSRLTHNPAAALNELFQSR